MAIKASALAKIIQDINDELESQCKPKYTNGKKNIDNAIQEIPKFGQEGTWTGFKPQYIVDAVNKHLGHHNWRYIVNDIYLSSSKQQIIADVELFIHIEDEWMSKGKQFGHMKVIFENEGDAYKGAITDAIGKCFSLWGVGSKAYKGLLNEIYEVMDEKPSKPKQKTKSNKKISNAAKELEQMYLEEKITADEIKAISIETIGKELTKRSTETEFKKVLEAIKASKK